MLNVGSKTDASAAIPVAATRGTWPSTATSLLFSRAIRRTSASVIVPCSVNRPSEAAALNVDQGLGIACGPVGPAAADVAPGDNVWECGDAETGGGAAWGWAAMYMTPPGGA